MTLQQFLTDICLSVRGSVIEVDDEFLENAYALRQKFHEMKADVMDLTLDAYHKSNANGVYQFLDDTFAQRMEDKDDN